MAMFMRRLPDEVRAQVILLGTASPSARCFHAAADDMWTSSILEAFNRGHVFHADERRVRGIESQRESLLWLLWNAAPHAIPQRTS